MSRRVRKSDDKKTLQNLESSLSYVLQGDVKRAEQTLNEVRIEEDEFARGYRDALKGLLKSLTFKDGRDFIFRLKGDPRLLRNELSRLKESVASHLCTEYDLGYFKCWTSYLEGLMQLSVNVEKKSV